jgi:hypothetical protein
VGVYIHHKKNKVSEKRWVSNQENEMELKTRLTKEILIKIDVKYRISDKNKNTH